MPDEIEELSGDEMGGGGGGGREAKDDVQVFWQATSLADHLPKFNTGGTLQFFHGQRSVRKNTPDVKVPVVRSCLTSFHVVVPICVVHACMHDSDSELSLDFSVSVLADKKN